MRAECWCCWLGFDWATEIAPRRARRLRWPPKMYVLYYLELFIVRYAFARCSHTNHPPPFLHVRLSRAALLAERLWVVESRAHIADEGGIWRAAADGRAAVLCASRERLRSRPQNRRRAEAHEHITYLCAYGPNHTTRIPYNDPPMNVCLCALF